MRTPTFGSAWPIGWQHVEHLRARLAEVGRPMRTAEPVDRPGRIPASLEPVTAAELEAALIRLRALRPLSPA